MNKIIETINKIKPTKKNFILCMLLLFVASTIFVIPFINAFVIRELFPTILACVGFGLVVLLIILFCIYSFKHTQSYLTLTYGEIFVELAIPLSVELVLFAIISFLSMMIPPLFVAIGIVILLILCGLNIELTFKLFKDKTQNQIGFYKFVKSFNIVLISILVVIWLII